MLTAVGFEQLRQVWPTQLASVRRHIIDHVRGLDLRALTAAFQRFATAQPDRH